VPRLSMRVSQTYLRYLCCGFSAALLAISTVAQEKPAAPPPLRITLADALNRARSNSVVYQAALTDARIAHEDKKQAITTLLPSVSYNNSAIYTEGTGAPGQVKFIANNAVHEYISQGNVHETLDVSGIAEARRAAANAAVAKARAEIASRGLVVTVVQSYYGVAAAARKLDVAQKAANEGDRFLQMTNDLEKGGEVAHSDVIKAELQRNDRQRQLQEAKLGLLNARLDLAVLIFPNFDNSYELADDLHAPVTLASADEVEARAARDNPDIKAALETVNAASHGVSAARAAYLPGLDLDYFYGIDATHFATRTDGVSNLGSSGVASLNIPIWNWGATQSKVKQAEFQRDQAKRELSLAQRKLLAELKSLYAEAQTAADELSSLQRSAELGTESLRLTTLRYKNGESTVLEVVDAQTTSALADAAYEDGAVRYRVALANLQTLTGELTTP
jgi:outer membrane protein TolC